jgi:hypothetical protein
MIQPTIQARKKVAGSQMESALDRSRHINTSAMSAGTASNALLRAKRCVKRRSSFVFVLTNSQL